MQKTIYGFIGLGNMGGLMAGRLLAAGETVHVVDRDAAAVARLTEKGAIAQPTPVALGNISDVIFLSIPDGNVLNSVVCGADGLVGATRVKQVVDLSTVGPDAAKAAFSALAAQGITYIDSPVSGGIAGAQDGTLAVMVSCPRPDYDALQPILKNFGPLFYMGAHAGQAQVMKLANNLLSATAVAITAEAMALGVKSGLNPATMLDVINAGSGRNSATVAKFPKAVLTGTYNIGFTARLAHKDVRLCLAEAESIGIPMIVGSAVKEMLMVTTAALGKDADYTDLSRVVENWAGIKIRG